jgi:hypothetical protein
LTEFRIRTTTAELPQKKALLEKGRELPRRRREKLASDAFSGLL